MTEASTRSGRPVTFGLSHTWNQGEHYRRAIELVRDANARGASLRPQTTPRFIGVLTGISHRTPFDRHPAWAALGPLDLAARAWTCCATRPGGPSSWNRPAGTAKGSTGSTC